jgi:hypothetical protein
MAWTMHSRGTTPVETRPQPETESTKQERKRALRILAKSIHRDLVGEGFSEREILGLAGDLIGHVTAQLAKRPE